MAFLKASLALLALSGSLATAQERTQGDLESQNRNAECANDCLFDAWPEGYCVDDKACQCNNQENREAYLCCVADKCVPDYWQHALELTSDNCDAFGIPFTFDVEEACGFTPSSPSSSAESATATATETSTETATASATDTSETETESASATASPDGETDDEDSESTTQPNGAAGRGVWWAGMAVAAAGAGTLM